MTGSRGASIAIGFLVIGITIVIVWEFPTLSVGPASALATISGSWDFACASALVPIALYFRAGWNPQADRNVHVDTKKFIRTSTTAGVAILFFIIWLLVGLYVIIPLTNAFFLDMAVGGGKLPAVSLLVQILLIVGLPVLCVTAASPAGVVRTFRSAYR